MMRTFSLGKGSMVGQRKTTPFDIIPERSLYVNFIFDRVYGMATSYHSGVRKGSLDI